MKIILKYKINILGVTRIKMKCESEILSCHSQGNDIFIWALCDNHIEDYEERNFYSAFTGKYLMNFVELKFIETTHTENSGIVSHVFEIIKQ